MSSDASAAAAAAIAAKTVSLGYDLLSSKHYWIAITTLWVYEYLLTFMDEVRYIWKEKKNLVFWLFFLNRYLCLIIIVITNVAYFTPLFSEDMYVDPECYRYGFVEQIETLIMGTIAEALVLLRVYALSGRKTYILIIAFLIILTQWILLIYQDAKYVNGTSDLAVLLFARKLDTSALPTLPDIDAYRLCIAVPGTDIIQVGTAFLSLYIVYDGLAVIAIVYFVMQQAKGFHVAPIVHLIQRDGLLYFAVMFSSNFVWLITTLHAGRPGLKFIQNQPAMVISSIMVNRITVNLKRAATEKTVVTWGSGRQTVEDERNATSFMSPPEDIELGSYGDRALAPSHEFDYSYGSSYGYSERRSNTK
ncbi:hypothetical protein GYMLUDRAFT_261592 [Collybiopsis luxurians FD-317 M1]|uniref:DUF6533 domain-containing protein n=1 Tax=Collybiopsis luxurians FD-317 M1 TaxID=944289 RepID=A0A0D0BX40_9AGAR|nr:hypothetical protein GYMLUDRAFT_261592 [Collybiopsis luxurians FD-317 M1]